jgi:hypothetical protein
MGGRIARGLHQRGTPFPTPARQLPFRSGAGKRRLRDLPDSESGRRRRFVFLAFFWPSLLVCDFSSWVGRPRDEGESRRHENATLSCPGFEGDALLPSGWAEVENHGTFLMPESWVSSSPGLQTAHSLASITEVEHWTRPLDTPYSTNLGIERHRKSCDALLDDINLTSAL